MSSLPLWLDFLLSAVSFEKKENILAGCRWLTPVIPAQVAEIRRIAVRSQTRKIVFKTLSQKNRITKKGWWTGSRCRP
jgi:hypothetical protein